MSRYLVGSSFFFSCYPDFFSNDIDEVELIDTTEFVNIRQDTRIGRCLFQVKKQDSKEAYIQHALKSRVGMVLGKFLVPDFCKAIGLTIQDLARLRPLLELLDSKHRYESIIFEAYLENNDFVLTEEQRLAAYNDYKNSRLNNT